MLVESKSNLADFCYLAENCLLSDEKKMPERPHLFGTSRRLLSTICCIPLLPMRPPGTYCCFWFSNECSLKPFTGRRSLTAVLPYAHFIGKCLTAPLVANIPYTVSGCLYLLPYLLKLHFDT
jgi:hypothetical protein